MTTFTSWDTELCHSGKKGMKWGFRRYQNEDGSLTPLGRIHYGYGQVKERIAKASQAHKERRAAASEQRKSNREARQVQKQKNYEERQRQKQSDFDAKMAQKQKDREAKQAKKDEERRKTDPRFMSNADLRQYIEHTKLEKELREIQKPEILKIGSKLTAKFMESKLTLAKMAQEERDKAREFKTRESEMKLKERELDTRDRETEARNKETEARNKETEARIKEYEARKAESEASVKRAEEATKQANVHVEQTKAETELYKTGAKKKEMKVALVNAKNAKKRDRTNDVTFLQSWRQNRNLRRKTDQVIREDRAKNESLMNRLFGETEKQKAMNFQFSKEADKAASEAVRANANAQKARYDYLMKKIGSSPVNEVMNSQNNNEKKKKYKLKN